MSFYQTTPVKNRRNSPRKPRISVKVVIKSMHGSERTFNLSGSTKDAERYKSCFTTLMKVQRDAMVDAVAQQISVESAKLAKSKFRRYPADELQFNDLYATLKTTAPSLATVLQAAVGGKQGTIPGVVMAAAVLLNKRNRQANAVQKMIGFLLYQAKAHVEVYQRLSALGLCPSYSTVQREVNKMCETFDKDVLRWKESMEDYVSGIDAAPFGDHEEPSTAEPKGASLKDPKAADLKMLRNQESGRQPKDRQNDTQLSSPERIVKGRARVRLQPIFEQEAQKSGSSSAQVDPLDDETSSNNDEEEENNLDVTSESDSSSIQSHDDETTDVEDQESSLPCGFHIVFDNLSMDTNVNSPKLKKRLNLVHGMAIRDRVPTLHMDFRTGLTGTGLRAISESKWLLSREEYDKILDHLVLLVQRSLCKHMKFFRDNCEGTEHITHQYSDQMTEKSKIVSLGVLEKDPNNPKDMIAILEAYHKYVPKVKGDFIPIPVGGDGLTAKRGEDAQIARKESAGASPEEALEGFVMKVEDWHKDTGVMLQDVYKRFYEKKSDSQKGTLSQVAKQFQLKGVWSASIAAVHNCRELLDFNTHGLASLAAMKLLDLKEIDQAPSSSDPPQELLKTTAQKIVHQFAVDFLEPDQIWNMTGTKFACGYQGCSKTFSLNGKSRANHRRKCKHRDRVPEGQANLDTPEANADQDSKHNYTCALLREGLLNWARHDAVKEGDGERVYLLWKHDFLYFYINGHHNYKHLGFIVIAQQLGLIPPAIAHSIKHNRFVNLNGGPGGNVSMDFANELLNDQVKPDLNRRALSNPSADNINRFSRSIDAFKDVVRNVDNQLKSGIGRPSRDKVSEVMLDEVGSFVKEYAPENLFEVIPNRRHKSFPKFPKSAVQNLDGLKLHEWIEDQKAKSNINIHRNDRLAQKAQTGI